MPDQRLEETGVEIGVTGEQWRRRVEGKPDIIMPELAAKLDEAHGVREPPSSLLRVLVAQGFTYNIGHDGIEARTRHGAAAS
tara:strand:- start:11986 stop:12231 length:246 start_codon:yes stop_codon:yes gene_type:complete